ncbi:MAG: hypothetical protein LLF93_03135 [Bacteroidales bacterium]|nr:hypothetical protein [Bacteroidales bacterium]
MGANEVISLSGIKLNESNPRTISEVKLDNLVDSVLTFPQMLRLRPVVVGDSSEILGGNMRYRALVFISGMTAQAIRQRLGELEISEEKKKELGEYWAKWLKKPVVEILRAENLTEEQKHEFIIKDNLAYGEWDKELLASWDKDQLQDWGLNLAWAEEKTDGGDEGGGMKAISTKLTVECENVEKLASLFEELQKRGFKCELS